MDNKGSSVQIFSTQDLAQACRIFLNLAYRADSEPIPPAKQAYRTIPADALVESYLPPAPIAVGICQDMSKLKSAIPGYDFRLGSSHFPHLKLRIQKMDFHQREVWVYSVETHDHFHQAIPHQNAGEAERWRNIVERNRALKKEIEDAFSKADLLTPRMLLRLDLTPPPSSPES